MTRTPADYVVIRFTPDPARHELLNLGIAAWCDNQCIVRFDEESAKRIVRQNPHLASDFFPYVETEMRTCLESYSHVGHREIAEVAKALGGPLMSVGDPLLFAIPSPGYNDLASRVDDLVKRIVTPRKLGGGAAAPSPTDELHAAFRDWIKGRRMETKYSLTGRTGIPRTVAFYSNSGANVAVDALMLDVKRADEIIGRADREANKARDLLASQQVQEFIVYCRVSHDKNLGQASNDARKIMSEAGAKVETNVGDLRGRLEQMIAA